MQRRTFSMATVVASAAALDINPLMTQLSNFFDFTQVNEMLSDDLNNVSENRADLCSENPQKTLFNDWAAGLPCTPGTGY